MILPLAGFIQTLANLAVIGIVLGFTAYGVTSGLFIGTLVGMQTLATTVIAIGFTESLASLLISLDVPSIYAFPVAFCLLATGVAVATRLLIGRYVPAEAVRFPPLIDKAGGGLTGGVAGMVSAGGLLIVLSILPLPQSLRIDSSALRFDLGQGMLRTFARIVEPETDQRKRLLGGDEWEMVAVDESGSPTYPEMQVPPEDDGSVPADAQKTDWVPQPTKIWSEPYADMNNNDQRGDDEIYLDVNEDGQFSPYALRQPQIIGDPIRFVGLLDRYRLHQWERWHITEATWDDLYPPGPDVGKEPTHDDDTSLSGAIN